jgi:hypothetical protein
LREALSTPPIDERMDEDGELELDGLGAGGELGLGLATGGEMGLGLGTGVRGLPGLADAPMPPLESTDDFELCKGVREKGRPVYEAGGAPTQPIKFDVLKEDAVVKQVLVNWESLYVQFREKSSGESALFCDYLLMYMCMICMIHYCLTGKLLPIHVVAYPPPPEDNEDDARNKIYADIPSTPELIPSGSSRAGKRKAPTLD